MKFAIEQRVFIAETSARKKKIYRKYIRKFRREYLDLPLATKSCVSKFVKKWRATGSVCDIKKQSKRIVLTDEKVGDIEARLQISTGNISDVMSSCNNDVSRFVIIIRRLLESTVSIA
jgi:hypothetical protein